MERVWGLRVLVEEREEGVGFRRVAAMALREEKEWRTQKGLGFWVVSPGEEEDRKRLSILCDFPAVYESVVWILLFSKSDLGAVWMVNLILLIL